MKKKKRGDSRIIIRMLTIIYLLFILYFLLFSDWYGRETVEDAYRYNLVLFKEIKRFWEYRDQLGWYAMAGNLLGNIVIFVPYGILLKAGVKRRNLLSIAVYSFGLSLFVETVQLVARVGSFDVDDLLLNTLGGIVGYIIYAIYRKSRRRR